MFEPSDCKVLYVAFEAFPRPKGASTHMVFMLESLARAHETVGLVCLGYGDMPALQQEGRIQIFRYKEYHPNLLRRAQGFARFVQGIVQRAGPGLERIVFRDPWGGAPALSAAPDCQVVFEVNALPSWELAYTRPGVAGDAALLAKVRDLEVFCLEASDLVVTVSSVTARALSDLGVPREKIRVVPNGAAPVFLQVGLRSPQRPSGLGPGPWVGYVGSLHPWQGMDFFLEAFALVAQNLPNLRLAVVHPAKKRRARVLARRARKLGLASRIRFLDPMAPDQLADFYRTVDLTVAPLTETSRNVHQGCCPVKIVESMACGTPVLASDLEVTRALVAHGQDGWLARPQDTRRWALALVRLFSEDGLLHALGQGARQRAERDFSWPLLQDRLLRALAR